MLEKIISSLKQSLPEPILKILGISNQVVAAKNHFDEKTIVSHDSASNNNLSNDDEEKKKRRKSMILRVIIVIALGYLAYDQFILNKNAEEATVVVPPKPRKKRIPKENTDPKEVTKESKVSKDSKDSNDSKVAEIKPDVSTEIKKEEIKIPTDASTDVKPESKVEKAVTENVAPIENINIADKKSEETSQVLPEEKITEEVKPLMNSVGIPSEPIPPSVLEKKEIKEKAIDKKIDSLIDIVDEKKISTEENSSKKVTKLEDKIVEEEEYTASPTLETVGRGLVYNCKDKFWACVDKVTYVNCNKNMKWNKSHDKTPECAVDNVYSSDEDCGVVQKYNISISKPTPFCQK